MANEKKTGKMPIKEDVGKETSKDFAPDKKGAKDRRKSRKKKFDTGIKKSNPKVSVNDPSWYENDMIKNGDTARLFFSNPVGMAIEANDVSFQATNIVQLSYVPTFGNPKTAVDAINLAARNMYVYVRMYNSGHTNYEATDLNIYINAITELISYVAHIERIFGLARSFKVRNRLYAREVLLNMGMVASDIDDLIANWANYRARLNIQIARLNTLVIPSVFKIIERRIWMNSCIFKDHESDKAGLFYFAPIAAYKFDPTTYTTGGCLYPVIIRGGLVSMLLNLLTSAIDSVLADDDMAVMSGDILKAYGAEKCYNLQPLPEDYFVYPIYVEEMLPQIHNLTCFNAQYATGGNVNFTWNNANSIKEVANAVATSNLTTPSAAEVLRVASCGAPILWQENGVLKVSYYITKGPLGGSSTQCTDGLERFPLPASYRSYATHVNSRLSGDDIYNSFSDNPTPDEVLIGTRLHAKYTCVLDTDTNIGPWFEVTTSGTELITNICMRTYDYTNKVYTTEYLCNYDLAFNGMDWGTFHTPIVEAVMVMDWFPIITLIGSSSSLRRVFHIGDLDNYTTIAHNTLEVMNDNAALSLYSEKTSFEKLTK